MQVNQSTSPNFGKLTVEKTPQVARALRQEKVETLRMIQEVGEKLKDTKFYHLFIKKSPTGNNVLPKIVSEKDAYFGEFESSRFTNIAASSKGTIGLSGIYGVGRYLSEDLNNCEYNVWGIGTKRYDGLEDIGILSDIALELDKAAVIKYNERVATEKANELYQKEVDALTEDIFANFGK